MSYFLVLLEGENFFIEFDGKEYSQIKFRIRANKYLKRVVSKDYAQGMTTEVSDIALENLQYYFTIYR